MNQTRNGSSHSPTPLTLPFPFLLSSPLPNSDESNLTFLDSNVVVETTTTMWLNSIEFSVPTINHHQHPFSLTTPTHSRRSKYHLRLPIRRFSSLRVQSHYNSSSTTAAAEPESSEPSISSQYVEAIGLPANSVLQLSQWNLTHRHILLLIVVACAAAVSTTWLFLSAIPTLLAFKRAAESLEKLMDVTREELPDTMAAVRLSGMEISDLTIELSELGQEITQGVRSSTRAVRVAEERLRPFTYLAPTEGTQSKN